jgi:hypothetical protein
MTFEAAAVTALFDSWFTIRTGRSSAEARHAPE